MTAIEVSTGLVRSILESKMSVKLSDKQQRFCEEYVIDWNGTRAAIAAGYSEKSARQIATVTLSKDYIQDYINKIKNDLSRLSGVTALRNILELKKLAYANLAMFKDDWMTEKEFNELTDDQKACLSEITHTTKSFEGGDEKVVKFKLHDKMRAIEIMNKMLGFNDADRLDITSKGDKMNTPNITVSTPEAEQTIKELFGSDDDKE